MKAEVLISGETGTGKNAVARELNHIRGNQTEAATLLGVGRNALWAKRKRDGLE